MGPGTKPRVVVIDVLRLVAAVEMINGHTLDAVLSPTLRDGAAWAAFSWGRGLVSVAFMVAAGLSFHVTTLARFDAHRADPSASRARIRRAIQLVVIGYVLRFPFELVTGDPVAIRTGLARVAAIDVLQTIGLSLLALELLVLAVRRAWQAVAIAGVVGVTLVALAPLGDAVSRGSAVPALTAWLGHGSGSLFPLLPYSAYVLFGVVAGAMALPDGVRTLPRVYLPRLVALAALAAVTAFALLHVGPSLWHRGLAPASAPAFVVTKLATVLCVTAVLALALSRVRALPAPLTDLSGETLAMYVFHLVVLYWTPLSLHQAVGATLSVPAALGTSAVMIVVTLLFALAWHWRKDRQGSLRFGFDRVKRRASASAAKP